MSIQLLEHFSVRFHKEGARTDAVYTAEKCSSPTARRFQKHTFQVERATPSPALQAWGAHKMLPHVLNRASQRAWPLQAFVTVAGLRPRQTMTPNPFQGPQRGQPDILDRAGDRCKVHLRQCTAAKYVFISAIHHRGNEQLAAFQYPLHFQTHKFVAAFAEPRRGGPALSFHHVMQRDAQRWVSDMDNSPGLHETDAWRVVRSAQQTFQCFRLNVSRFEMTHVAPFKDRAIDSGNLSVIKAHLGLHRIPLP